MRRKLLILALVVVVALAAFIVWALYFTIPKPAIASNAGDQSHHEERHERKRASFLEESS